MLAFHNDPAIKEKYISRVIAHRLKLENNHREISEEYEIQLGIPRILALLQIRIFKGLGDKMSEFFPDHFLRAVNVGADLTKVWPQFAVWLLVDPEDGVIKYAEDENCIKAIRDVADLYQQTGHVTKEQWRNAANAARATAWAAAYGWAANAPGPAADPAGAAAWAVTAAAAAAANAPDPAADAAGAAAYAAGTRFCTATYVAEREAYRKQADKLLELISNIKKEI